MINMQNTVKPKVFLLVSLSVLFFACNSNTDKKDTGANDKPVNDSSAVKPAVNPPGVETNNQLPKKCFENNGLKYNTSVTIIYLTDSTVSGTVTSESLEDTKKENADFEGKLSGDKLTIAFKGTAPVVGDASEWTNKPWVIKKSGDKEKLQIIFNAKNYDTNKWGNTTYEFDPCK